MTADGQPDTGIEQRWGQQTELAIANFPISGEQVPASLIRALAMIKAEAAVVNGAQGVLHADIADAVRAAAEEVAAGHMADQFPVDVFQTGSGTSSNMNVNEVIAHRAAELAGDGGHANHIHPNDHVNASQSSNDTFPAALRVSAAIEIAEQLLPSLEGLAEALRQLAGRHRDTVKMARTHLMDALPMTFGQEVGGWARRVELDVQSIAAALPRLLELPVGGTAVGTGLNAPAGFGSAVAAGLSARTGLLFVEAADHFEAQSSLGTFVELAGATKLVAVTLNKIAGDLRLLASGPNGGLAEVQLQALQAGSSMMPGKVNPVIPEAVQQVAAQVVGNEATITFAAGTCSSLQLPTAMPVVARALLSSLSLLSRSATVLSERCIATMEVDEGRMRRYASDSPALATALAPRIGYAAAASAVADAADAGMTVAELIELRGLLEVDGGLDLLALARPHESPSGDRDQPSDGTASG